MAANPLKRNQSIISGIPSEAPRSITWVRHAFGLLCLAGMSLNFTMRETFDVVIWNHETYCFGKDLLSFIGNRELVFISYFFGYVLFQPVAGRLSELYGAKWVLWSGCVVFAILHVFTPMMINTNQVYVMMAARFVSGVSSAVMYPALAVLIARWAWPSERFAMCGLIYGGVYSGIAISIFVTTWIMSYGQYEHAFYLEAGFTASWLLGFAVYARNYPQENPRITREECDLYETALETSLYNKQEARQSKIPWKGIFTSAPFYAVLVYQVSLQMVFHVVMSRVVFALHTFQWKSDMKYLNRALLVATPLYWCAVISLAVGMFFYILEEERAIEPVKALRFCALFCGISPLICLPADYFAEEAGELSINPILLIVHAGFHGMIVANHIYLSPNYTGTLVAMTNGFSTVCGMSVGLLLRSKPTNRMLMKIVYGSTALVSLIGTVTYLALVSTEIQEWNNNLDQPKSDVSLEQLNKDEKIDNLPSSARKIINNPSSGENGRSWFTGFR